MKKTLKILAILAMMMLVVFVNTQYAFASEETDPATVVGGINVSTGGANVSGLQTIAGKILGLIRVASAIAAVVLIAVFGFKFIMGSANEKADYQKAFIPLIVGVVVVFAASSIASLIFSIFTGV